VKAFVFVLSLLLASTVLAQPSPPGCGINRSCSVYSLNVGQGQVTLSGVGLGSITATSGRLDLYAGSSINMSTAGGGTMGTGLSVIGNVTANVLTANTKFTSSQAGGFESTYVGASASFTSTGYYGSTNASIGFYCGNAASSCLLSSGAATIRTELADGANTAAVSDSVQAWSNANAKLHSFRTGGSERAYIGITGVAQLGLGTDATAAQLATATGATNSAIGSNWWLQKSTMPNFGYFRRWGMASPVGNADGVLTTTQLSAASVTGTPVNDTSTDTNRLGIKCPTTAVANNSCNWRWSPVTRASYDPTFSGMVNLGSAITLDRVWFGVTSADLSAVSTSAASTYCAFRYDTGAGDSAWTMCSANGATQGCTATSVTVAANTSYQLRVQWSSSANRCLFDINGVSVGALTSNVSASTSTDLGPQISVTTLSAAIRPLTLFHMLLEQN
jgi:hypothetical protein